MLALDAVFENARFWTQDPGQPWAERIGVLGGKIVALDDDLEGVEARSRVDLGGRFVCPGFNDAHHHLSQRGYKLRQLDLRVRAAPDLPTLYSLVQGRLAAMTPDAEDWLIAIGYDENKLGRHPELSVLDRLAPERPLWIQQVSGHLGVVNSAALRRLGLDDRSADPGGGRLGRDAQGSLDGVLYEQAQQLVFDVIKPVSREEWLRSIAEGNRLALREGITSAAEPGVSSTGMSSNSVADIGHFAEARAAGLLEVRMNLLPEITALHEVGPIGGGEQLFGVDLGVTTGFGDDRLRIGGVKAFLDGSLIGRTAAMTEPYPDGGRGLFQGDASELTALYRRAHAAGWQLAIHAIGDAAIDLVLDVVEQSQRESPRPDPRHRIEHAGVSRDDQLERMKRLGIVPVPQARFVSELGDGMLAALGERAPLAYRLKSMLRHGLVLPGSSDTPVVEGAPLLGIHDAVNRRTASGTPFAPEEALSVEEAIFAFTVGSAFASHDEQRKGRLKPGMLADFVALDHDPFTIEPEAIGDVLVDATVIDGVCVYERTRP